MILICDVLFEKETKAEQVMQIPIQKKRRKEKRRKEKEGLKKSKRKRRKESKRTEEENNTQYRVFQRRLSVLKLTERGLFLTTLPFISLTAF